MLDGKENNQRERGYYQEVNTGNDTLEPIPVSHLQHEKDVGGFLDDVGYSMTSSQRKLLVESFLPLNRGGGSAGVDDGLLVRVLSNNMAHEDHTWWIQGKDQAVNTTDVPAGQREDFAPNISRNVIPEDNLTSGGPSFQRTGHPVQQNSDDIMLDDSDAPKFCNIWNYQQDLWQKNFKKLIEFRKKHGHCRVPHNWKADPSLALWIKRQRIQFKRHQDGKTSSMTYERQKVLEKVGFSWHSHHGAWEDRWAELREFKQRHGHCNVPSGYIHNPSLAIWVKVRRKESEPLFRFVTASFNV
jgi:hypothetical protein